MDQPTIASLPAIGLTTILMVIALGITVAGVVTSHTIFQIAGLSYADYATVSDGLTAGLRYPVAMLFSVATGIMMMIFTWLALRKTRLRDRAIAAIVPAVVTVLYILSSAMIMIAAPVGTLVDRKSSFWRDYLMGRSPRVILEVDGDAGPVKDRLAKAKEIRQLATSADYFLLSVDNQPLALRKELVRAIWPQEP